MPEVPPMMRILLIFADMVEVGAVMKLSWCLKLWQGVEAVDRDLDIYFSCVRSLAARPSLEVCTSQKSQPIGNSRLIISRFQPPTRLNPGIVQLQVLAYEMCRNFGFRNGTIFMSGSETKQYNRAFCDVLPASIAMHYLRAQPSKQCSDEIIVTAFQLSRPAVAPI